MLPESDRLETIHGCLEILNLFLVLNRISHSFDLPTREISWSTPEINFINFRTIMYYSLFNFIIALLVIIYINFLDLVQTSNFSISCAESNANELKQRILLIRMKLNALVAPTDR